MNMILNYNQDDGTFLGFYELTDYLNLNTGEVENITGDYLIINEELWQYLISQSKTFKIVGTIGVKSCYEIDDKNLFEFIEIDQNKYNYDNPLAKLESENAELLLNSVQKDIEISNLQSDIANILLQLGGNV